MRKHVLISLLLTLLSGFSFSYEQKSIDLVVVLDTSSSMYAHSQQVSDFVIGPLLKDFLRYGDSFHLISFSSSAKIEISRKIENIGDIETIMGRLLLLYPLDKYSDIIAALQYTSRYLTELPENRAKTVIFITDGDHNPSPTSPNKLGTGETLDTAIREAVAKLKGNGWTFHYIHVPQDLSFRAATVRAAPSGKTASGTALAAQPAAGTTAPSSSSTANTNAAGQQGATPSETKAGESTGSTKQETGAQDVSSVVAQELNIPVTELHPEQGSEIISTSIGAISVEFPISVGKVHRNFTLPLKVKNPSPNPVYLETQAVLVEGTDRMRKKSFKEIPPRSDSVLDLYIGLPETYQNGATTLRIEPQFSGSIRINPPSAPVRADVVSDTMSSLLLSLLPIVLLIAGILLAAAFAVLIIIVLRRLQKNPSYAMAEAIQTTREESNKVTRPVPSKEKEQQAQPFLPKDTSMVDLMAEFARKKAEEKNKGPALPLQTGPAAPAVQQNLASSAQGGLEVTQPENKKKNKTPVKIPSFSGALSVLQEDTGSTAITKPSLAIEPSISVRRANGRIMLSLFVQDQNTAIGKRNVHLMKAGHRLTLGGHNSDFLIFLVPIPHRIADVHFDGEELTLIPRKSEFFPDTGAEPIYNCVGKTIHLRSAKGYDLYIRFEKYQNPLDTLNNFLRSIEVSGTSQNQSTTN
ncbi:VWA domain-containing protein [Gracilinema caldarium]|uniref:VWA domain-containing protein n=1 Tax=Gracilinema caldarium TaxID=215591 RepID=UPI0026F0B1CE|nr:VWA domain-containing protein [Gracilinema caldarium]